MTRKGDDAAMTQLLSVKHMREGVLGMMPHQDEWNRFGEVKVRLGARRQRACRLRGMR